MTFAQKKGDPVVGVREEHQHEIPLETLARVALIVHPDGGVIAGNASGVNDSARALLAASEAAARTHGLA